MKRSPSFVASSLPRCLLVLALCGVGPWATAAEALNHEQAVQAARDGRYDDAVLALKRLAAAGDDKSRWDLVVVLGWAGRPLEATAVFEALPAAPPAYVQRAAAASYRSQRRTTEAETLLRAVLKAQPDDAEAARLLSGVLTDGGRGREAVAFMQMQVQRQPADAEHWLALGNAALGEPGAEPYLALRAYLQALKLQPGRADVVAAASAVLQGLGAPFGAALQWTSPMGAPASATPTVTAITAPLELRVAQAGRQVRWATQLEAPSVARRFEAIDAALAQIDRLLIEHHATPGAEPALRTALRFDQLVAQRHRERWHEVLAAADALRAEGLALPAFVRQAEADALLATRQPEAARLAYTEVLAHDPGNRDAEVGRIYAALEAEDLAGAIALADRLAASQPEALRLPRDPTPRPNSDWLDGQTLAAMIRSFSDLPAEAWQRLQPLADGAPAHAGLRAARGSVSAARGWPRLADEELRIAATLAPDDTGIRIDLADSAMRRQRWPEARERLAALQAEWPEHRGVNRLATALDSHDRAELDTGAALRRENGNASAAPGSGIDAHLRLHSAPLAEADTGHWRAVAVSERHTAEPEEGQALRLRYGLGAVFRGADTRFEALAWHNRGALQKDGASLAAAWTPDDHLWLGAEAEAFARDVPLRALLYGITADAAALSASYRWHESASVAASLRALDFSDGNQRRSVSITGLQRLVAVPFFTLDVRPGFYASSNSLAGGPYFNPVRDRSVSVDLEANHQIWRRYERSLNHQLVLALGSYWQQDYGAGAVGGLRYQQRLRFDPLTEWRWGLEFNRSRYDGVGENAATFFINLNQRF